MSASPDRSPTLCVLGGSSPGTVVLVDALGRAYRDGILPLLQVRLYGRAAGRLQAIAAHARHGLAQLGVAAGPGRPGIAVSHHTRLAEAAAAADLILCQVRIGGMRTRARDEQLPLEFGIPGDEGLGPSGLACFLRSRPVIRALSQQCATVAPGAVFLMMSSPLGLLTATATEGFGPHCYGICELPTVTATRVVEALRDAAGLAIRDVGYLGLNHQGWLHDFRDAAGNDLTSQVLAAIDGETLLDIDSAIIRREGAIPLPYLRLYYHTGREVARQGARTRARGTELAQWSEAVEQALLSGPPPDHPAVAHLLARRNMQWYEQGVVPAIGALLGTAPRTLPLNLPDAGAARFPGRVVEAPCRVQGRTITQLSVPPLPASPGRLMAQLVAFEAAALALPEQPGPEAITAVLQQHPLVTDTVVATTLGRKLWHQVIADAVPATG